MANTTPALPMLAPTNDFGASVNEAALCIICLGDDDEREYALLNWLDADDVTMGDQGIFTPVDNPDATCNGCGALTLEEYIA